MIMPDSNETTSNRVSIKDLIPFILHPRSGFMKIARQPRRPWMLPLLLISLTAILCVVAAGYLKQQAALTGEVNIPPDFDYYTPEQQAQYFQATQATQGVTFVYILPIIGSLFGVWTTWLVTGGTLHFITTLFGGRGETVVSMNVVAWASLPLAIRNLVRFIYMLLSRHLIEGPGLSGLVTSSDSNWSVVLSSFLGIIDIYLIWYVLLLVIGVKVTTGLSSQKSIGSVIITFVLIAMLQVAVQFLIAKIGDLSISRPFYF